MSILDGKHSTAKIIAELDNVKVIAKDRAAGARMSRNSFPQTIEALNAHKNAAKTTASKKGYDDNNNALRTLMYRYKRRLRYQRAILQAEHHIRKSTQAFEISDEDLTQAINRAQNTKLQQADQSDTIDSLLIGVLWEPFARLEGAKRFLEAAREIRTTETYDLPSSLEDITEKEIAALQSKECLNLASRLREYVQANDPDMLDSLEQEENTEAEPFAIQLIRQAVRAASHYNVKATGLPMTTDKLPTVLRPVGTAGDSRPSSSRQPAVSSIATTASPLAAPAAAPNS